MRRHGTLAASVLLSAGMLAAGISPSAVAAAHHAGTKISTRHTKLGRVLTNSRGRVMYIFGNDGRKVSHCNGACAAVWPKVTSSSRPRAAGGVRATHLSRTSRHQVTYFGHPLYYFASGKKPGNTSGEGLNKFYVVSTSGKPIKPRKKPPVGPNRPAKVTTGTVGSSHIEVITSRNGHTLYALTNPDETSGFWCGGSCLRVWVPLLTKGAPTAGGDAQAAKLGTISHPGAGRQVTYNGFPVYDYTGDTAGGQDSGEGLTGPYGLGQKWDDLTPAGAFNTSP